MSSDAAMSACAVTTRVLAHLMFGMTNLTAQPTDAPYRSADLVRLVSFAKTENHTSRKTVRPNAPDVLGENSRIGGCANADPTIVGIKIAPIAVRGRRC